MPPLHQPGQPSAGGGPAVEERPPALRSAAVAPAGGTAAQGEMGADPVTGHRQAPHGEASMSTYYSYRRDVPTYQRTAPVVAVRWYASS